MNRKTYLAITVAALATVLVLASSCTKPANHEPVITNLEAEAWWTAPSGSLQVVCTASDPDGDELGYVWWASGGYINGGGASVTWTAPASEGSLNVTVKVIDGHGGEVTDYVVITVRANNAPTIASLIADADWTTASGSVRVTCAASDPDGDELSYEWTATAGNFSGTGAVVNWTAPQTVGEYDVVVVARDIYGGMATSSVTISVLTGQPPVIEGTLITADHCYLKAHPGGYYVGKGQVYNIGCTVADTRVKLFYEWSCTGGEFSGEGSLVTWTAPNESVEVMVAVTVSDISGRMASDNITLSVVSCSYCMFGC